jgi:hypothetical protein
LAFGDVEIAVILQLKVVSGNYCYLLAEQRFDIDPGKITELALLIVVVLKQDLCISRVMAGQILSSQH